MESRYDKQAEAAAQALWNAEKVYDPAHNTGDPFTIDTPPPTVSGSLHIGHIFSYTQTDIIARYKRMRGYSVIYPFGFDDNGLPTERFVEKRIKTNAHAFGRSDFIQKCLTETREVEEEFKMLWQRMGLSVNWNLCYATISDAVRRISQASFLNLWNKKYVYRTDEPALYCTTCRTSVAQAELDDIEMETSFNTIIFKDQQDNELPIATTRPELLSSCVALFYNLTDTRYQHLRDTTARVPLFNVEVPIYEDNSVIPEKGTGLVMCCTFGDTQDIQWYKLHKLPLKQSIGRDGKFVAGITLPDGTPLSGLKVPEARIAILEALKKEKLLRDQKIITHAVSVHERCKQPIEYISLPQWFVHILKNKQIFIQQAEKINWHPEFMKARYIDWVEHLKWDWCISRQRFYGIPFPMWHCTDCGHALPAQPDQLPIDPQEQLYKGSCPHCKKNNIVPDTDVMDTWATSALTPYIIAELFTGTPVTFGDSTTAAPFLPMSMRPQAHDIIRTWAFYTITRAWMHDDKIPWNDIVISGHVLSNQKEKLSKSQGNTNISPDHLLNQYSADVIRYWTASGGLGHDVPFSENQCKIGQKLITKLWNAFRFIQTHCTNCTYKEKPADPQYLINQWILHRVDATFGSYYIHLDTYEFSVSLDVVELFFWHEFCDNYLELIKDQLFKPERYSQEEVNETRETLYHLGLRVLQLYAPYIPHITETIYQQIYKNQFSVNSIHQLRFDGIQHIYGYKFTETEGNTMKRILAIVSQVRKRKSEKSLSLNTPLHTLTLVADDAEIFKPHQTLIAGVTGAEHIEYQKGSLPLAELHNQNDTWRAKVAA